MKEMEKFGAVFAEEGAGKKAKEKEIELERIMIKDQMAKLAADKKREDDKANKLRENTRNALLYNDKMLEDKKKIREKQLDEYLKAEEDKKIAKKIKNEKYRKELDAFAI